jgi:uncharacterized iron-regulated membrane protein
MNNNSNLLRSSRTWHRKVASIFFVFFFIISLTAVLLGWKNLFAAKIYKIEGKQQRAEASLHDWLPLDSLKNMAIVAFKEKMPTENDLKLESMNARLDRGFIRFSFGSEYNVQLNALTGELQSIDKRAPQWILHLHSGELFDELLGIKFFEKAYPTVLGLSLFFLTLSGFWMWFKTRK